MKVQDIYFQHDKKCPFFFEELSFSLEPGKLHALHGKNGVGKSVLLNILAGHLPLLSGTIEGGGIALVRQQFDQMLAGSFSFEENLRFATMGRFPSPFKRLSQTTDYQFLISRFNINPKIPVQKLSGGQRQILALLMVLQRPTQTLLLDEPTAALDEQNALMVFSFLETLPAITKLVVCHDRALINRFVTGSHLHLLPNRKIAMDNNETLF